STAAGLVIYDDKFAYSHHGTDPVSGKLCNAFDLVRLHLFGDMDENVNDRSLKPPSFKAMTDFVRENDQVKKQIYVDRLEEAKGEFSENGQQKEIEKIEEKEINVDWVKTLEVDKQGNYANSIDNVVKIL